MNNVRNTKIENIKKSLKYIFLNNKTTRKDISQHTNLSNSSITRVINYLMDNDFILKANKINESRYGRKSEMLIVNKLKLRIFVVDIDVNTTMFGEGYFDGTVELLKTIPTPDSFDELNKIVNNYIKALGKDFYYISYSIPGIVDIKNKRIKDTPNLKWKDFSYNSLIKNNDIILDNDSNLSILAEKIRSEDMKDKKNAIFILIKEGIGSGLLLNDEIYRGFSFSAGEIGHNYVLGENIKFEHFIDFERNYEKTIDTIALNISYTINLLNLEKVIIGGKIINYPTVTFRELKERIQKYTYVNSNNIDVRITEFNYVPASMIGACVNGVIKYIDNL